MKLSFLGAAMAVALTPGAALACACGCGIFDVGDGTFMPSGSSTGFTAWFRYDYMDQGQNWEGSSKAPAADNQDKDILTSFYTFGGQYTVNRQWSVMGELPIYDRAFTSTDDGTVFGPAGSLYTAHLTALGDLQVAGTYTGISPDMSTGLSFGLKLPTGDWKSPMGTLGGLEFDRDSMPGTGSTDVMVGGYHVGKLAQDGKLSYFVQARYQVAVLTQASYRPGNELDAAAGLAYNLGAVGPISKVAPGIQLLDSYRVHDTGSDADPLNSGYERLVIAPDIELRLKKLRIYAEIGLPIYQHVNAAPSVAIEGTSGQLVAPSLFKVQLAYDF